MTFRIAYEIALVIAAIVVAYQLIIKPIYSWLTRSTLDVTVNTAPKDTLRTAQQDAADAETLDQAASLNEKSRNPTTPGET